MLLNTFTSSAGKYTTTHYDLNSKQNNHLFDNTDKNWKHRGLNKVELMAFIAIVLDDIRIYCVPKGVVFVWQKGLYGAKTMDLQQDISFSILMHSSYSNVYKMESDKHHLQPFG